jgi:hypothetical protein
MTAKIRAINALSKLMLNSNCLVFTVILIELYLSFEGVLQDERLPSTFHGKRGPFVYRHPCLNSTAFLIAGNQLHDQNSLSQHRVTLLKPLLYNCHRRPPAFFYRNFLLPLGLPAQEY